MAGHKADSKQCSALTVIDSVKRQLTAREIPQVKTKLCRQQPHSQANPETAKYHSSGSLAASNTSRGI
jgi:hypothetical protein